MVNFWLNQVSVDRAPARLKSYSKKPIASSYVGQSIEGMQGFIVIMANIAINTMTLEQ